MQLDVSKDYSFYNRSVVRTQLDVCLYWYFDPWSPINVIKLSIKVVKTLRNFVTNGTGYDYSERRKAIYEQLRKSESLGYWTLQIVRNSK
jgi:hypothetical protein